MFSLHHILIGLIIIGSLMFGILVTTLVVHYNYYKYQKKYVEKYNKDKKLTSLERIEYSNKVLDSLRDMITDFTVIEFQTFIDGHKLEKTTLGTIKNQLIKDIANKINIYINKENINFTITLFNKEFYDQYIVSIIIVNIKLLLNKHIETIEE